jgi:hypothetical protein
MKILGRLTLPGVKPHTAPQTMTSTWRGAGAALGGIAARPSTTPTMNADPIGFSDQRRLLLPVKGAPGGKLRSGGRL